MSERIQQQGGGRQQRAQQQQAQQQQAQQQQAQQQQSPAQRLARALQDIRQVQSFMELNYPQRRDAIALLREAGDLVWNEIERMQLQQQQRQ
jgi:ATP-dependent RNA helicase MSS116, mitochondrial